jgi:hypothetical protein
MGKRGWRALSVAVVIVAGAVVVGTAAAPPAAAACAAPAVTVSPPSAPRGAVVTISGRGFSTSCNDTRFGSAGCSAPVRSALPQRGIELVLARSDWQRTLATVDGLTFEAKVRVPDDAPVGEATVEARVGGSPRAHVAFTVTDDAPVDATDQGAATATAAAPPPGFVLAAADGGVFTFGARTFHGSAAELPLAAPIVGIASSTPNGYTLAAADGGVFTYGDAEFRGARSSEGNCTATDVGSIAGIATRPQGGGYWTATRRGYVFDFDAGFHGAAFPFPPGRVDHGDLTAIAAHPGGFGYWQASATGGVFSFGEAPFAGSAADLRLARPIVAMTATPSGDGYWLAAADGGVFAFGDAGFHGSVAGTPLRAPIVGLAAAPDGLGYWLAAADGGVFAFGSAPFLGSLGDAALAPIVAIAA